MGNLRYVVSGLFMGSCVLISTMGYAASEEKVLIPGDIAQVVSLFPECLPADDCHQFRAIFSRDHREENPIQLRIEKIKLPVHDEHSYSLEWRETYSVGELPKVTDEYQRLPAEVQTAETMVSDVKWSDGKLEFRVKVGTNHFNCSTTSVLTGRPKIAECK